MVSFDEFTKLYQTTYAFVIVYICCISATKTSILLFYRRVFGKGIIWNIVFTLTICHCLEVSITWLSGCRPVSYYWRQYTDPTAVGKCIDAPLFYFINGIIGLFIDISILLVPVPTSKPSLGPSAWLSPWPPFPLSQSWEPKPKSSEQRLTHAVIKLQMPPTKKIFIGGILLIGGFVCIASAVRIVMMDQLVKSADFTWAMSKVFIWSCCEPFIGIVCACLPTYAPLVRRWYSRRQGGGGAGGRRRRRGGAGGGPDGAGAGGPDSDKGYYYPYYHQGSGSGGGNLETPPPPVPQKNGYITDKPGRREWSRGLHGLGDTTLRGEDEIELTVDIRSGRAPGEDAAKGKGAVGEGLGYRNEILVRKDFSWVSSA